jgi:glycosyltransferase involved in cell wall biosynthesis
MSGPRITILHVLDDLETGGSERQLTAFLVRSDQRRFRHVVCALSEAGRFSDELSRAGIEIHTLGVKFGWDLRRSVRLLRRLVDQVRPDLLHATLYRPGLVSRFVGWRAGIPVITTLVNTTYEPEWLLDNPNLDLRKVWVIQMIDRLTSRLWGTWFVAVTETVRMSAIRQIWVHPARISVIRRGLLFKSVPTDTERNAVRESLGWADAHPLVLNVGRMVAQKGQQHLIRAMRSVVARHPSAQLVIAGEGPLRGELEALIASEGLTGRVHLLGDRRDVDRLLYAADIFAFPSLYEGAANALLEAMAAEKPCIVTNVASLRELTEDGRVALLAELRSADDFAAKIIQVADDPALAERLGRSARVSVIRQYDIDASVVALEALYTRLVQARRNAMRAAV